MMRIKLVHCLEKLLPIFSNIATIFTILLAIERIPNFHFYERFHSASVDDEYWSAR